MWTHELTQLESLDVLAHTQLGRLACVRGMQPYVVPVHFAYHGHWVYSFSSFGQKIEWMRANPLVCVEVDDLTREQWTTVVVFGRYEELCDTPEFKSERALAFDLLKKRPMWWERGGMKEIPENSPAVSPIFYRIKVEQITGRRASSQKGG